MGGSKERTTVGLQVERLVDAPEKAYKASMREAYKNVGSGMRSVMRTYQRNIIDSKSLFNDGYLNALGYNPGEFIKYRAVDPALVLDWCKTNVNSSISGISSYRWGVPTIEEIALEYLQDTYGVVDFTEKSFSIESVKWFVTGVTTVSSSNSDATLLKNKEATIEEYASANGVSVVSIEDGLITVAGTNYWRATLSSGVTLVKAKYMTIVCPGVGSDVVGTILAEYGNREYHLVGPEDEETHLAVWSNTVVISTYIKEDGTVGITGKYRKPIIGENTPFASTYVAATQDAFRVQVDAVQREVDLLLLDSLDRLVVSYVVGGVIKLKIAEIDKNLVSSEANAKAYPVIPIKENYGMVKENTQMKAMLNKLGMATSDFEESLADTRLKNAAIMFIIDLNDDSEAGVKLIFETLIGMVKTTVPAADKIAAHEAYQLTVGYSDMDMKTTINMDIVTSSGTIAEVGKCIRYTYDYTYEEIDPENNVTTTKVTTKVGIKKQVTAEYYQQMEFGDCSTKWKIGGYELGGRLGASAGEDNVYLPITDIGLAALNYEEATYAVALSMHIVLVSTVTTKTKWYQSGFFKFVVLAVLVVTQQYWAIGIMFAVEAGLIGGKVAIVLSLLTMNFNGIVQIAQGAAMTGEVALSAASTLVQLASMAVDINTIGIVESIENKRASLNSELETSEDQLKEVANQTQQGLWMGIQDRTPDMLYTMSSTALMCNYSILYDYDGMYEGKINSIGI